MAKKQGTNGPYRGDLVVVGVLQLGLAVQLGKGHVLAQQLLREAVGVDCGRRTCMEV